MKVKTSELTGAALDWAVAKAQGFDVWHNAVLNGHIMHGFWVSGYYPGDLNSWKKLDSLRYSTDWSQGGPIIEREGITTTPNGRYERPRLVVSNWCAAIHNGPEWDDLPWIEGHTPLIAAMRCYVASKLGDEVEVPYDLA